MDQQTERPQTTLPATPSSTQQALSPYLWTLRFKDATLEERFLAQMLERDRASSRSIVTTALIGIIIFSILDFSNFPTAEGAWVSMLIRLPAFFVCWLIWVRATYTAQYSPKLSYTIAGCSLFGSIALVSTFWIGWAYHAELPYQSLLLIPLLSCLFGCMPWRLAIYAGIGSAITIALPEVIYQPDSSLRNLHLAYIFLATFISISTGYILEIQARRQFLVNNSFLEQSRHDPLTGLPNRRELDTFFPRLIRQAARDKIGLAVAMLDVDHFKAYNDHYGHAAGDEVLKAVSKAISEKAIPRPDFVARYGGEEFVAIWYNPTSDGASLGEGLRQAVEATALPHERSGHGQVSISVGIAFQYPTSRTDMRTLLASADRALYRAKDGGRNCVRVDSAATILSPQSENNNDPNATAKIVRRNLAVEDPSTTNFVTLIPITPADRRRWSHARGFYERYQYASIAKTCIIINTLLALINYFNLPPAASGFTLLIQALFIVPALIIGYWLTSFKWAQRISRYCVPLFLLTSGLPYCYSFYHALSQGTQVPYEIILFIVFQSYIVGGHSWRSATVVGWLLSLICIWLWTHYSNTPPAVVAAPFVALNILGMFISAGNDRRGIDAFLKAERLEALASQDALTGLANRQGLENYFRSMLPLLSTSSNNTITVAMIDVDHFKAYNDYYGHAQGDIVLSAVGQVLAEQRHRPYDFAARYGGEEFILVWYQVREKDARTLGERVCQAIREMDIPHCKSRHSRVTVSIGIAHSGLVTGGDLKSLERLIRRADLALYRAKATGRNRVVMQSESILQHEYSASAEETSSLQVIPQQEVPLPTDAVLDDTATIGSDSIPSDDTAAMPSLLPEAAPPTPSKPKPFADYLAVIGVSILPEKGEDPFLPKLSTNLRLLDDKELARQDEPPPKPVFDLPDNPNLRLLSDKEITAQLRQRAQKEEAPAPMRLQDSNLRLLSDSEIAADLIQRNRKASPPPPEEYKTTLSLVEEEDTTNPNA